MANREPADEAMRAAIVAALPRLRRFCHAMAGGAQDGDDLMQSTVERALTRWDRFQPGTRIESWMFRIAQNLRIDTARAAGRRGPQLPVADMPDAMGEDGRDIVERRSDLAAAQTALDVLPHDQRAAFVLVVVEGLSYRDTADILDIPVGTVMSRLARARSRIELAVGRGPGQLS